VGKIKNVLQKVNFKEVEKDNSVNAYTERGFLFTNNTIYINSSVFENKSQEKKISTLLHEFMHVLQNSKFLFTKNFAKLNEINQELYSVIQKEVSSPLSQFLTSSKVSLLSSTFEEVLPYIMSGTIDWSLISKRGKIAFINVLKNSNVFNMNTKFWKEILGE
jgi:hypothetical protein